MSTLEVGSYYSFGVGEAERRRFRWLLWSSEIFGALWHQVASGDISGKQGRSQTNHRENIRERDERESDHGTYVTVRAGVLCQDAGGRVGGALLDSPLGRRVCRRMGVRRQLGREAHEEPRGGVLLPRRRLRVNAGSAQLEGD